MPTVGDYIPSLYFDLNPAGTIYEDAAGTIEASIAGVVGNVPIPSEAAVTQSDTSKKPTLEIDGNGHRKLSFDGVDDYLSNNTFQPPSSGVQPFELTIVAQAKGTATVNPLVSHGVVGGDYKQRDSRDYQLNFGGNFRRGVPNTLLRIHQVVVNGASSETYIDGSLQGTAGNAGTDAWAAGIHICTISGFSQLGYQNLYRVLVHGVLTSLQRSDLYAYLADYYDNPPPSESPNSASGEVAATNSANGTGYASRTGSGSSSLVAQSQSVGYVLRRANGAVGAIANTQGVGYILPTASGVIDAVLGNEGSGYVLRSGVGTSSAQANATGVGYVLNSGQGQAEAIGDSEGVGPITAATPTQCARPFARIQVARSEKRNIVARGYR